MVYISVSLSQLHITNCQLGLWGQLPCIASTPLRLKCWWLWYNAKGRGIETRFFLFFRRAHPMTPIAKRIYFRETKIFGRTKNVDRENAGAAKRRRRTGKGSGMATRKAFGSFERRLNGERRLNKGLTWCEKYNVLFITCKWKKKKKNPTIKSGIVQHKYCFSRLILSKNLLRENHYNIESFTVKLYGRTFVKKQL